MSHFPFLLFFEPQSIPKFACPLKKVLKNVFVRHTFAACWRYWQSHVTILQLDAWNHSRVFICYICQAKARPQNSPPYTGRRESTFFAVLLYTCNAHYTVFACGTHSPPQTEASRNCIRAVDSLKTCNETISRHRTALFCFFPVIPLSSESY